MRRQPGFLFLVVLGVLTLCAETLSPAGSASSSSDLRNSLTRPARLSDSVSIQAAGRGNPHIGLSDGHELVASYVGEDRLVQVLLTNVARPLALAAADFDEDGVPDLLAGYEAPTGEGIVVLHRGNVDSIYPNSPEAQERRANGTFTEAPFLTPALVYSAPAGVDFVGAGDFDADGHCDVVTAGRDRNRLYLLSGDGRGDLAVSRIIHLQGGVTALAVGEINRRDGLDDLVVGITTGGGETGAKALVFAGPDGALQAKPEEFALPAAATSLALGQLDKEYEVDLAIAAGRELVLVYGRDRKLTSSLEQQERVQGAETEKRVFQSPLQSLAIGDFTGSRGDEIALLCQDGHIRVMRDTTNGAENHEARPDREPSRPLSAQELGLASRALATPPADGHLRKEETSQNARRSLATWELETLTQGRPVEPTRLIRARVSSSPRDTLLLADANSREVRIVVAGGQGDGKTGREQTLQTTLPAGGDTAAILPMRLNRDGLSDLVVLKAGSVLPTVIQTEPQAIFSVTTTADNGNNSSPTAGSLRAAILNANNNPGADTITFNISGTGVRTISPPTALPVITGALTIDGYSQPGASPNSLATGNNAVLLIELSGTSAGATRGLNLGGGNGVVRGLIINRFSSTGIGSFTNGNNTIEGNFIGVNASGTSPLGNGDDGVVIFSNSSDNRVGGSTAAARNLISGNNRLGVFLDGNNTHRNMIQGNYIGTDAAGNAAIGNQSAGVHLQANAMNNLIGGPTAGHRNVISGNTGSAIQLIADTSTTGNQIQGNYIGTNATATAKLGNGGNGVLLFNANSTTVGGASAAVPNIIGGSTGQDVDGLIGNGIILVTSLHCLVQNNYVGTNLGRTLDLGNSRNGIAISQSSDHGTVRDAVSAYNGRFGVVVSINTRPILLRPNVQIFSNVLGGLKLFDGGFPNQGSGIGSGITSVSVSGNTMTVNGYHNNPGPSYTVTLDLYSGAYSGSGQQFSGAIQNTLAPPVTVTSDANGLALFSASYPIPQGSSGHFVNGVISSSDNTFVQTNFRQIGTSCSYTLTPATSNVFPGNGGTGSFQIQTPCSWRLLIPDSFVDFAGSDIGEGSATINYTVLPNPTNSVRTTILVVEGRTHTVTQAAAGGSGTVCTYSLNSTAASVGAASGNGNFAVTTQPECSWTAVSSDPSWLTTSSSGTGSGTVTYAVTENTVTSPRTATITAGNATHTVTQAAASGVTITSVVREGKHLRITGSGFAPGAFVYVNGVERKGIEITPTGLLGKKAAKGITQFPAQVVVRNADGSQSNAFPYSPPAAAFSSRQ